MERHVHAMKHTGKIAICLAGGLVLQINVHALTTEGSPYASIVKQNVFRLKSPPPVEPSKPVEVLLSKIVLLGIVCGPGPKQVMFKVLTGTPPRETSYALGEKEIADEFEVVEIAERAGLVRVRNHGQEQTLTLERDGMKPGGNSPPKASAVLARPSAPGLGSNQPQKPALNVDEQMVLMEINRKLTAGQVKQGVMPPLPPTPITGN
jgi:hypothetical protein